MSRILDATDQKLLDLIQRRGRIKKGDLAEAVAMSIPSVTERIRRLESKGIIEGYHAHLNALKVGLHVSAFITIQAESPHYTDLLERAQAEPQILECHAITGAGSHLLKVRTPSTESLESLLSQIQSWPGIKKTNTHIILSSPKEITTLPLQQLENTAE